MTLPLVRVGSLIKLKPEYEKKYIVVHKKVPEPVLKRITRSNIRNYSIFLSEGILSSYFDYVGENYVNDMNAIGDAATKEWWKITDPMQESFENRKEGEWWTVIEEIQHFNVKLKSNHAADRYAYTARVRKNI